MKVRSSKVKGQARPRTCFRVGRLLDDLQEDFVAEVFVFHAFVDQSLYNDYEVVVIERRCQSHHHHFIIIIVVVVINILSSSSIAFTGPHKLQSCSVQCSLLTNDTIKTPAGAVTHQRVWERKFPSGVQGLRVKGQNPHLENEGLGAKSQKLSDFILLGSNCFDFLHINDT